MHCCNTLHWKLLLLFYFSVVNGLITDSDICIGKLSTDSVNILELLMGFPVVKTIEGNIKKVEADADDDNIAEPHPLLEKFVTITHARIKG